MTKEMEAYIYRRVACNQQPNSLDRQLARCRAYAEAKGYTVTRVFEDCGLSGNTLDRSGLQAMLVFLKENKYKNQSMTPITVLVADISRLSTRHSDCIALRNTIVEAGGKLESPTYEIKDTPDSRFIERVMLAARRRVETLEEE